MGMVMNEVGHLIGPKHIELEKFRSQGCKRFKLLDWYCIEIFFLKHLNSKW